MSAFTVNFKKFAAEAKEPTRGSEHAAAYDIYSLEEVTLAPGETKLLRTGLGLEVPARHFLMIAPRSSLCLKKHLDMPHSVGIIDEDYVGEIMVPYRNIGSEPVKIEKLERFAQMVFIPYTPVDFQETEALKQTERGTGGFGSSGKF